MPVSGALTSVWELGKCDRLKPEDRMRPSVVVYVCAQRARCTTPRHPQNFPSDHLADAALQIRSPQHAGARQWA